MVHARETLEKLIKESEDDYASVSRLIGRNPTYIHQYIRRGSPRRLDIKDARKIATHFNVSLAEFGYGEYAAAMPSIDTGHIEIAEYDVSTWFGGRAIMNRDNVVGYMNFPLNWLDGTTETDPEKLGIISVIGDSMEPFLHSGDRVVVDTTQITPRNDGIYVVQYGSDFQIRRLSIHPVTNRVTISSDNAAYETYPDIKSDQINVIGRVVWLGRRV